MNDFGKTKEVLIKVKELFQQLLFILETEGDFEVNYAKTELAKNIRVLEGFLGEKMDAAAAQEVLDHIKKALRVCIHHVADCPIFLSGARTLKKGFRPINLWMRFRVN
ncbi:MAG: hypothetical protein GX073_09110 [Firmicutes bacterium]|nr:hypothetical protein [Bacillota bacterium]